MMTIPALGENTSESDSRLWQLICQGSAPAFEILVRRYQSLVCSVAYSTCGNLALSEDVAQETFWAAWRQRATLKNPETLKAWLCGIARNLAKNAHRKASRSAEAAEPLSLASKLASDEPGPADEVLSREEESLVWQALERIPETYREPLILFYREDRSVAEVASALVLSEDAVKQRLSRGRGMVQERLAELVESGLRRSRPNRRFTVTVMAGLAAHAAGAKIAQAGMIAAGGAGGWKAAASAVGAGGTLGGLAGTLGGFLGGWLGTWIPAQAAPTRREHDAILRAGRRMLFLSVIFTAGLFGLIYAFGGTRNYGIAWLGWTAAFSVYIALESVRLAHEVNRIRAKPDPNDLPNNTPLRTGWNAAATSVGDRVYRSEMTFLGLPLIDINLNAPIPPPAGKPADSSDSDSGRRIARGWIAIGDDARGILLAIGSTARGLIALGGRALGVVSLGGLAVGLVAFGGVGLGILGVGGLGAGAYALGGGAIGWRAAGGLAIGWDIACGGGAIAEHSAIGGLAIARDCAIGGEAHARHANDHEARTAVLEHPFVQQSLRLFGQHRVLDRLTAERLLPEPAPNSLTTTHHSSPTTVAAGGSADSGRFALDNGLTVRIKPIAGATNTSLLLLYNIGGDHDPEGQSGIAHLVEHLYITSAAGTEPARTADAFFQRYSAGCNAQTGDRYTVFATVFPQGEFDRELTEAAARMGELRITADDLNREKRRLVDEVANMFGRIPALGALNVAHELIRPTPHGGRKGGLPEQVQALALDAVQTYWKRYYKPRNAILVLAGAVDEPAARQAVTKHFAKLPAGEAVPKPGEPGSPQAGALRELTVKSLQPQAEPMACLAYAAPAPDSNLYAPFLVLVARFWAAQAQAMSGTGGGATARPTVYFPLLEDPAVFGISASAKPGEKAPQAIARLESIVAETIARPLRADERASASQMFAPFLGTAEIPDFAFAQNPYGAALSLARREQLAIDGAKLRRAFEALTEQDIRRTASKVFAPTGHAAALVWPEK